MSQGHTKKGLYNLVAQIRDELGLTPNTAITNSEEIISQIPVIELDIIPIQNPALHGICSFGSGQQADIILLNSNRSNVERNFDCLHEFIHLHEHRGEHKETFYCYDCVSEKQDSFLEWQANEGAAELLVPYQDFIPRFWRSYVHSSLICPFDICESLAEHYHVPLRVITIRLESLAYELDQYRKGIPIDDIELLSRRQRERRGIHPTCYSALLSFPLEWNAVING